MHTLISDKIEKRNRAKIYIDSSVYLILMTTIQNSVLQMHDILLKYGNFMSKLQASLVYDVSIGCLSVIQINENKHTFLKRNVLKIYRNQ